eukprot:2266660-Pleurochrysis_carterae.AAC.1
MARSPILNMVSIIVATGTTLNIAADRIRSIGSRGGYPIYPSVSVDRLPSAEYSVALVSYLGPTNISRVETPNAIGNIAISEQYRDRDRNIAF